MMCHLSTLVLFFLLCSSSVFCQKNTVLPADEFGKQITSDKVQILDVRTSEEYTSGHIQNALQADWLDKQQFKNRVQHIDKAKPVYVYCGSGVRSSDAARWLKQNGFHHVFELEKGIVGWKKNNKPLQAEIPGKQVTLAEYYSLLDTSSLVLVDFGAKWCPPCKKMEPILETLQKDLATNFKLVKADADIHTVVMRQLKVETLPTFILYKNGKQIWRKEGIVTLEEFKAKIQ